jgi:hypothetical protein
MEVQQYIIDTILKIGKIKSMTHNEKEIMNFVIEEVIIHISKDSFPVSKTKNIALKLDSTTKLVKQRDYGIFIENQNSNVLYEAHLDNVRNDIIKPFVKDDIVVCTGLDNKISIAVLLAFIKFNYDKKISYLFTIKEEDDGNGAEIFYRAHKKSRYKKVVVFDVCFGQLSKSNILYDTITKIVKEVYKEYKMEFIQDNVIYDYTHFTLNDKQECNLNKIIDLKNLKELGNGIMTTNENWMIKMTEAAILKDLSSESTFVYSIPVIGMHQQISYCCLKDVMTMYNYITKIIK